jgi:hypothetical protein
MKRTTIVALAMLSFAAALCAQPPPAAPQPPCTAGDKVVCGQQGPEDLVSIGTAWVAASAMAAPGGLRVVRTRDRAPFTVYPAAAARERHDRQTYPDCPGPPNAQNFTTHGLYAEPGSGPTYKLFAVAHGARESIEVFELDTRGETPVATWLGCAVAPDPIGLNSVRGLPDGGFIASNFLPRGISPEATQRMREGERNGELWEWHAASGWQKVPGSETAGANGLELSPDGRTLYVAAWGTQSFFRLSRGTTPPKRDEVPLGFRVDNIHWARDGSLFAVGQAQQGWKAVKIDPNTLAVRDVLVQADSADFNAGTALVEVGDSLWVGSFRGNRIVILPLP